MMSGFKLFGCKLFGLILVFFTEISKFPVKGSKTIPACTHKPLEIPCRFNTENATYVILEVDEKYLQGLYRGTMTFECNEDHKFAEYCLEQMTNSSFKGDTAYFRVNNPWPTLNQKTVKCHIRNNNNKKTDNDLYVVGKIKLMHCKDRNESTTLTSPVSSLVTTPTATASQPNASSPGVAETSSDKYSIGFVVVMCSVSFIVGAVLARAPHIYHCYIKYRRRDAVENDGEQNGNIPEEHPLNQEQTSEV